MCGASSGLCVGFLQGCVWGFCRVVCGGSAELCVRVCEPQQTCEYFGGPV